VRDISKLKKLADSISLPNDFCCGLIQWDFFAGRPNSPSELSFYNIIMEPRQIARFSRYVMNVVAEICTGRQHRLQGWQRCCLCQLENRRRFQWIVLPGGVPVTDRFQWIVLPGGVPVTDRTQTSISMNSVAWLCPSHRSNTDFCFADLTMQFWLAAVITNQTDRRYQTHVALTVSSVKENICPSSACNSTGVKVSDQLAIIRAVCPSRGQPHILAPKFQTLPTI
jgi:hypothetical protein